MFTRGLEDQVREGFEFLVQLPDQTQNFSELVGFPLCAFSVASHQYGRLGGTGEQGS